MKGKKYKVCDLNSEDDNENENIPDDEDIDREKSRLNI